MDRPVSELLALSPAKREASLAQRERQLAVYAEDVAARNVYEVEQLRRDQEELAADRKKLAAEQKAFERREKDLAAKLRATEEWEQRLRERGRRVPRRPRPFRRARCAGRSAEPRSRRDPGGGQRGAVCRDPGVSSPGAPGRDD